MTARSERSNSATQRRKRLHNVHALNFAISDSLRFKNKRISIIHSDPTTRSFVFWFFVSCYFPVITACLGPIANTISIACVIEKWRATGIPSPNSHNGDISGHEIRDPHGIFAVNVISLVLGFISNIVLFFHFARKLSYLTSQIINIFGWTVAGILLMVDCIVFSARHTQEGEHRTIGFWYACFTSGLYLGSTFTLTIHYIGYKLDKYPATFNLLPNERSIMVFTVFFSLWLIWGAGLFSGILNISFGNALYYCTVSILTVGFGDILPLNVASKIMILIFSLSGIIILGLIVFMTRSIIQKSSGPVWYFHRLETNRTQIWKKVMNGELTVTDEEAFELMNQMKKKAYVRGNVSSVLSTTIIFISFWLFGALIFKFAEGWSYFNAMYFCFLCLLTIGYGSDFAPSTGAGRAFFVLWGIGAIPLMGAIISTIGDLLFELSNKLDIKLGEKFNVGFDSIRLTNRQYRTSFKISTGEVTNTNDNSDSNSDNNPDSVNGNSMGDEETQHVVSQQSTSIDHRAHHHHHDDSSSILDDLEDITEKKLTIPNNNVFADIGSISDDDYDFDIIPPLAEDDSILLPPLEKIITNRSRIENAKFERLKHLLQSMRRLHKISLENKDFKLNYQQWSNIHSIYPADDLLLDEQETKNFWISSRTPLKYPLNEPHLAFLRISEAVDRLVDEIIEEQDDTYGMLKKRQRSASNASRITRSSTIVSDPSHLSPHRLEPHSHYPNSHCTPTSTDKE